MYENDRRKIKKKWVKIIFSFFVRRQKELGVKTTQIYNLVACR